jgi:hypothetical protein
MKNSDMVPQSATDVPFWGIGWSGLAIAVIVGAILIYFVYKMIKQNKQD